MPFSWIGPAISIGSALFGGSAAQSAADTQAAAANRATDSQLQMFNTVNDQQAPWRQAGGVALNEIQGGFGLPGGTNVATTPGQFSHQFDANDLQSNLAPNYAFQLKQGQDAATNMINATGGKFSGNAVKGIEDYTQNFAGNAYQNAFNNYNANQTNIFNRLNSIAGLGQTANASTAQTAASMSPGIANTIQAAGNAQAGGIIGQANALTGGANNAMGWYTLGNMLNKGSGGMNV